MSESENQSSRTTVRPRDPQTSSSFPISQTALFHTQRGASVLPYSPAPTPVVVWDKCSQTPHPTSVSSCASGGAQANNPTGASESNSKQSSLVT